MGVTKGDTRSLDYGSYGPWFFETNDVSLT